MSLNDRGFKPVETVTIPRNDRGILITRMVRAERALDRLLDYIPDDVREFALRDIDGLKDYYNGND